VVAGTSVVHVIVALDRVRLLTPMFVASGMTGVGVMLGVGVDVGVGVIVGVAVGLGVGVRVAVGVVDGVGVDVRVGVRVTVGDKLGVGVGVSEGAEVGLEAGGVAWVAAPVTVTARVGLPDAVGEPITCCALLTSTGAVPTLRTARTARMARAPAGAKRLSTESPECHRRGGPVQMLR
jgi:hypothetical protein